MTQSGALAVVRGGGDLASGAVARLHRAGFRVVVLELDRPLAVRRLVSFAEAVYSGEVVVEEIRGRHVGDGNGVEDAFSARAVPVLVDPAASYLGSLRPQVLVDGRMRKAPPEIGRGAADIFIGLGPGFTAGADCDAVVETKRGPHLGRVIWEGPAAADSRLPEPTAGYAGERVLRAPKDGVVRGLLPLGGAVRKGEPLAEVGGVTVVAQFDGVLRGLLHDGLHVGAGVKIGDLDPRGDPSLCTLISDKALAVGGGVVEAALSRSEIRRRLGQ